MSSVRKNAMDCDLPELLDLAQELPSDYSWLQSLAELVDVLREDAIQRGKKAAVAEAEAKRIVILIAHYWGGRSVYLPRNDKLRQALRNIQIYHQFDGSNVKQLAARYRLTDVSIYTIIKEQRAIRKAKQPALFGR